MPTISEEKSDSSDEDDDLKDTSVAILYVTNMFNKLQDSGVLESKNKKA